MQRPSQPQCPHSCVLVPATDPKIGRHELMPGVRRSCRGKQEPLRWWLNEKKEFGREHMWVGLSECGHPHLPLLCSQNCASIAAAHCASE